MPVTNEPKTIPELLASWQSLLKQAAKRSDVDADAFVRGAYAAYLEAHPGMKQHLEDLQLKQQLEELRSRGLMGEA
jgi:hypothetical protein